MKNEEFDDAVRQKLESINHTYNEGDIEKVFQHVRKNRRLTLKGFKGSWLFYSLAAAAMVAVTTLMISRFNENKFTVNQPVTINTNGNTRTIPPKTTEDTLLSSKGNNSQATSPSQPDSKTSLLIVKSQSNTNIKAVSKPGPLTSEPTQAHFVNKQTVPSNSQQNTTTIVKADLAEKEENPVKAAAGNHTTPDLVTITEIKTNNEVNVSPDIEKAVVPASQNVNSSIETKPTVPVSSDSAKTNIPGEIKSPNKLFTGTKIGAAATFRFSGQRIGMGVAGELLFAKHFGLTTGLTYNFLKEEQFQDKQDLYGHKHDDFNHHIHDHLQDKEHVSNITIQSQLLQLPVSINYYIPLKQNFSVRMSLGTDLDIYLKQNLKYKDHVDSTHFNDRQLSAKGNVVVFNNLFFGIGVEKRWNHLVLNIQPYFSQGLKQVYYKPKETEFGVGVSLKYSF